MTTPNPRKGKPNWEIVEVRYATFEESQERLLRAVTKIYESNQKDAAGNTEEVAKEEPIVEVL